MKIVVDTNIVFSSILNTSGKIGDLLLNSEDILEFFFHTFIKQELLEHHDKLKAISKLSDVEIEGSKELIFKKIAFINEELIPAEIWIEAENLTSDIDEDDTDFAALTIFLGANLWTGDKKLYHGLKALKGFKQILNTNELWELRSELESET